MGGAETMIVKPDPKDERLSAPVRGIDQNGKDVDLRVVTERPLTLFLNSQEIVTMMTIGDHPDLLALGYLINQNMLSPDDTVNGINFDDELGVVIVRTPVETRFEEKMKKKVRTSGCAQGTVFGDVIDTFETVQLDSDAKLKTSWLVKLTREINTTPSLYLEAGAIHGCVLCKEDRALVYMEDVGRHNAVDKIAGWMAQNSETGSDKIFYTTGRLTSEMIIKTVMMGIPILVSRSGFTAWGVELARKAGLTLIGRARGARFIVLSGEERIEFEASDEDEEDRIQKAQGGSCMKLAGIILAGGQSRRMGGTEKSLIRLGGTSPLQSVIERLTPQVETIAINANGDPKRFAFTGLPVIPDGVTGFAGPLAGVLAGMRWAAGRQLTHVLTAAADTPFPPSDLAERLTAAISSENGIAMTSSNGRVHPVCGIWPVVLADDLEKFLVVEEKRKILEFAERYDLQHVEFSSNEGDPFFNINTPEDLEKAKRLVEEKSLG